jgi:hypothetical protein
VSVAWAAGWAEDVSVCAPVAAPLHAASANMLMLVMRLCFMDVSSPVGALLARRTALSSKGNKAPRWMEGERLCLNFSVLLCRGSYLQG